MNKEKIIQALTAVCIALVWGICDFINHEALHFLKSDKFLYSIYFLAGLRLLAVILFGYVGFFGIFFGNAFSSILWRDYDPNDAIWLALLSSSAALFSYKLWQKLTATSDSFSGVSPRQIFYLIVLNGIITALFRFSYLFYINNQISSALIINTLAANISGAIFFLYIIKLSNNVYQRIRR
ncbi:MAG: hypothetical protein RL744_680 [Pseudomonadota bacterium]|jgi:hypothetical protein